MNQSQITIELERNKKVFESNLSGLNKNQYLWKPAKKDWCLLEIVCHLYDEEREDFGARLKQILESIDKPFDPIDPEGWVESRKYIEQDFDKKVKDFINERQKSIEWLNSVINHDWKKFYKHPLFGDMTAGMFLANWLAHDYIHIRQIVKIKYAYLESKSPENLSYAGDW